MDPDSPTARALNVIWRRRVLDDFIESQFIRTVLLSGLRRPVRWIAVEDAAALPLMDDILVCSFGDPGAYLNDLRTAGHTNVGVFHFGDEQGTDSVDFYDNADYVLRHYHFAERLTTPGNAPVPVRWVPNGWARGVGPADPVHHQPFAARRHDIFFAGFVGNTQDGQVIDERVEMLNSLRDNKIPATVVLSEGFGQGLGPGSYAAYMGDTKLALVPGGNSPETIRLYDALECGALPVVLERAWLRATDGLGALGPPPLITIGSWQDLPDVVAALETPTTTQRATASRDWWERFKAHTAQTTADLIEAAFAAH